MRKMFKAVYPIEKTGRCPQRQKLLHSIFFKGNPHNRGQRDSVSPARRIWPREEAAANLRLSVGQSPVPWTGEHYIRKSSKAGKPVMTVFDEYSISFYGILKKEYAQLLARLFLNTSGAMQKVQLSYAKKKLHKKTYSIQ